MMWEAAQGNASKWAPYLGSSLIHNIFLILKNDPLDTLPAEFDTPMFWAESDLNALKGTSVVGPSSRSFPIRFSDYAL